MDFREYQKQAVQTDQFLTNLDGEAISILGMVGEIGSLSSEYKKFRRDGTSHRLFLDRIAEELGDILWYVAAFANRCGLDLSAIAEQNLDKCRDRWGWRSTSQNDQLVTPTFDNFLPEQEKFPKKFEVEITEIVEDNSTKIKAFFDGRQIGSDLTDNSYSDDGYRFHDVFHLSYVAVLGWSPVVRKMLGCKRKSNPKIDEVEDGGRAIAIEEGISALVFSYAQSHEFLKNITELDYELLKTIKKLTSDLEVSQRSLCDWEKAILAGYKVWNQVKENGGGIIAIDLDTHSISYRPSQASSDPKPIQSELKNYQTKIIFYD